MIKKGEFERTCFRDIYSGFNGRCGTSLRIWEDKGWINFIDH